MKVIEILYILLVLEWGIFLGITTQDFWYLIIMPMAFTIGFMIPCIISESLR
ncbi:hypothetical protein LCGC14_0636100 [marine sediment metagenome]|uniref:Uncharacterized protein n=1 Tax=marine sediment metagenome TaxID=412755 RepID=A0A0F9RJU0_9ZZZZ